MNTRARLNTLEQVNKLTDLITDALILNFLHIFCNKVNYNIKLLPLGWLLV